MRVFVAALAALSMSNAAEASLYSGPLVAVFGEAGEDSEARLTYFDARCAEDEREECGVAALICRAPATVEIDLYSVASGTLSAWLSTAERPAVTLSSGGTSVEISLFDMGANEMDGGWYLEFDPLGLSDGSSAVAWFKTLSAAPEISVTTPDGDVTTLPSRGADGEALAAFLAACGGS